MSSQTNSDEGRNVMAWCHTPTLSLEWKHLLALPTSYMIPCQIQRIFSPPCTAQIGMLHRCRNGMSNHLVAPLTWLCSKLCSASDTQSTTHHRFQYNRTPYHIRRCDTSSAARFPKSRIYFSALATTTLSVLVYTY